jgi:CRP-like cAMP-binding protein
MPVSGRMSSLAENHLLAALPADEHQRLLPALQAVTFSLGEIVREAGGRQEYVYFPTTCVVSFLYTTEEGSIVEVGLTGNDGVVGVAAFLGGDISLYRAIVQIAGTALKMKSKVLQEEFARSEAIRRMVLCYTQALLTQVSQTAACNRLHSVEKRLCRWLLLCHDRVPTDDIAMTQEFISNMLGGRRESVTVAAGHLQDARLIQYSHGHIRILDRKGLEEYGCECYRVVKDEVDRFMGRGEKRLLTRQAIAGRGAGERRSS